MIPPRITDRMLKKANNLNEVPHVREGLNRALYGMSYSVRDDGNVSINCGWLFYEIGKFEGYNSTDLPKKFKGKLPSLPTESDRQEYIDIVMRNDEITQEKAIELAEEYMTRKVEEVTKEVPIFSHNLEIILRAFGIEVERNGCVDGGLGI